MTKLIHVAVGVIFDNDGNILIAKRADTAHQGGLWEFPGGKVEPQENVLQALARELKEELAISVIASEPLIQIRHHYPDKSVLLDVHAVTSFSGNPCGNEGQPIRWVAAADLSNYDFPSANQPIIAAIRLPKIMMITGEFSSHSDFARRLELALHQGVRMVQLRTIGPHSVIDKSLLASAISLCAEHGATLILNTSPTGFLSLCELFPANFMGLHLNRHQLLACAVRPVAKDILLGASCHDTAEIQHAQKIGVDYLVLSPVLKTSSHPDQDEMGWEAFAKLVKQINIPVYALGGMKTVDLPVAISAGAQGVAGIGEWWA